MGAAWLRSVDQTFVDSDATIHSRIFVSPRLICQFILPVQQLDVQMYVRVENLLLWRFRSAFRAVVHRS